MIMGINTDLKRVRGRISPRDTEGAPHRRAGEHVHFYQQRHALSHAQELLGVLRASITWMGGCHDGGPSLALSSPHDYGFMVVTGTTRVGCHVGFAKAAHHVRALSTDVVALECAPISHPRCG